MTTTRKVPQDHLPPKKTAAQREAEAEQGETVTITWRDMEFVVPATFEDASVEVIEAAENSRGAGFVAAALGPKQYAAWKRRKPTGKHLGEVADLIAEVWGLKGQGE